MPPTPNSRWFHLTPDRLILALLVVEGLLWLSDRLGWPVWHKGYAVLAALAAVGVAFLVMLLWLAASLLFRWRFQFSIRSLLVLVVVVAIPCSWMGVEMKKAREQKEAVGSIKKLRGGNWYDYRFQKPVNPLRSPSGPPEPAWLRNLLGEDFFATVVDVAFAYLSTGDTGLKHLRGLTQLQSLWLYHTKVTDEGLEHLEGLTKVQKLYLSHTQVTDVGLEHLKGMTQLRRLYLGGTQVTDEGVKRLQQALPRCKISSPEKGPIPSTDPFGYPPTP
jgi:hypothetical protein